MGDLIERLRSGDASWELREKAADEIERLNCALIISRGKHENAIAEIERLRAALKTVSLEYLSDTERLKAERDED